MPEFFSTADVAELFGTAEWRVRRLYESGALPEPPRFAGRRLIRRSDLIAILDALRARGWVPAESEAVS